jgi:NodT family efflux transporter outer membrane factor (OMF) lipoprotein
MRSQKKMLPGCLVFIIFSIFIIGGCAVGPDYTQPQIPEPKKWMEQEDPKVKTEPTELSQWWTVFNDPVLNDLIEMAFQQNLTLQIAGIRILEARAQLGIATGNLYPQSQQARGGFTYSSLSENTANTSPNLDLDYGEIDLGFDVAWELDFWGKFRRAVESGLGDLAASIANYDDILVTLTADVARSYVIIRTIETRLAIAIQNVKTQRRALEIASVRFQGGDVTELDVQQARALLRDTQALIPRLEISLRQAKNGLAILLGRLPGDLQDKLSVPGSIPTAPAEIAVGIPAELLRRRPDIRLAEHQLAAQSALIGVAKADLYPHFSLFGTIGLRSSNAKITADGDSDFSDLGNFDSIEFFGGPAINWDIFSYGRIKNRVRVQDARFQQLIVNYQNSVLRAAQETEDTMFAYLQSKEEVRLLSDSVKAAKRSVSISILQYEEGLVDYQRVLDTQRFQSQEEDLLTLTAGDVILNLIAMYKALGGGWQIRKGKDFVPQEIKEEMRKRTDWGKLLSPEKINVPADKSRTPWRAPDW